MTKNSEKEATVRDWEERWSSVKNWFTPLEGKKPYTLGTKHVYIRYLKRWCRITGLNPDQLAAVEDIDKTRGVIAEILHLEEGVPIRSL